MKGLHEPHYGEGHSRFKPGTCYYSTDAAAPDPLSLNMPAFPKVLVAKNCCVILNQRLKVPLVLRNAPLVTPKSSTDSLG